MGKLFLSAVVILVMGFTGCKVQRTVVVDSTVLHTDTFYVPKVDTLLIKLPPLEIIDSLPIQYWQSLYDSCSKVLQRDTNNGAIVVVPTIPQDTSILKTDFAISKAWVEGFKLKHTLENNTGLVVFTYEGYETLIKSIVQVHTKETIKKPNKCPFSKAIKWMLAGSVGTLLVLIVLYLITIIHKPF